MVVDEAILAQATFSFLREYAKEKFLQMYNHHKILQDNPLVVLDLKGTGKMMKLETEWGRGARLGRKIGICGKHRDHSASIHFS